MKEESVSLESFELAPIKKAVSKQIIPAIVSQMIVLLYNLADTYFVGFINDPSQTAAVAVVAPSFIMLTAISNLFGVGGASMIAHSLGEREHLRAEQISTISIYGGIVCGLILSLVFYILSSPILRLCGATKSTFDYAFNYAKWVVILGGPFTILNTLFANLVRSEGYSVIASIGVSFGGILNILLDALFVLPKFLNMGVVGAGIATAISNFAATVLFIIYIVYKRNEIIISFRFKNIGQGLKSLGKILSIGFPSAVQYALTVVAVAAQAKFVSKYGTSAVAGLGIVKKIDQLPLYFSIGVSSGLLPLLAYNYARKKFERQKEAFIFGCSISLCFSLFCLIIFEIFAPNIVSLFIGDKLTRGYGAAFLRIMVLAMPMMSVCYPLIIQFQAMGKVSQSLICSVLRKGVIDIPLLFIMDRLLPLYGCMIVQPIVDSVSLIVALFLYKKILKQTIYSN